MLSGGQADQDASAGTGPGGSSPGETPERVDAGKEPDGLAAHITRGGESVVAFDRDWRFTYVNRNAALTLGRPATELIGLPLWETYPTIVGGPIYHHYQRAMTERTPVVFEERSLLFDVWLEERCLPTDDGGLLVLFHDITQRKAIEAALQNALGRYELATRSTQTGVWEFDSASRRWYLSPHFPELLGYPPAPEGLSFDELVALIHPDDYATMSPQFQALLTGDSPGFETEIRLRHQDGSWRWFLSRGTARQDTGAATRVTGIYTDITARHTIEEELRSSREFIEQVTETMPDLVFLFDAVEQRNVYSNHSILEIVGYSPEEIKALGAALPETLIHPDDWERWPQFLVTCAALPDGAYNEDEWRMRHRDGSWRILQSRAKVFSRNADGSVRQILGMAQDITGRKATEDALQRSEEQLRAMSNAAPLGIFVANADGNNLYVNPAWERILGRRGADSMGKAWLKAIHPDDRRTMLNAWADLVRTGATADFTSRFFHADGIMVWGHVRIARMLRDDQLIGYVGTVEDVSDKKRAEEALQTSLEAVRLSEERFRSLVEATSLVIWRADVTGRIDMDTPAWRAFTGQSSLQARGRGWMRTMHLEDQEWVEEAWQAAIRVGEPYQSEYRVRRSDGLWRWLRSRAVPVRAADGSVREWIGTLTDITERKEDEEERSRAARRDKRIAQMLQTSLLPATLENAVAGFELRAVSIPLLNEEASVGGDFYDAFPLADGLAAVVVGDVMGKGLTAAISIAEVRFALRGFLREDPDPSRALQRLNRFLLEAQRLERRRRNALVSLALAVIDTSVGDVRVCVAGAEAVLAVRPKKGEVFAIEAGDLVLGAFPDAHYETEAVRLDEGDVLAFTTDGITEARTEDRIFGREGVTQALMEHNRNGAPEGLDEMAQAVVGEARAFAGGAFRDDICLLLARRL